MSEAPATPWAAKALEYMDAGAPCALVSLLAVEGSAPREAGTRMLVTSQTIFGTIGGGNLEFEAIDQARRCLHRPAGTWWIQDYPLGVLLGQCCGGRVRLMIEHLHPGDREWLAQARSLDTFALSSHFSADGLRHEIAGVPAVPLRTRDPIPEVGDSLIETIGQPLTPLTLFGAGHVGIALVRVLEGLPFRLRWYDDRSDVPRAVRTADPQSLCDQARIASGLILILTHDHALDYELVKAALGSEARFIGLIGSKTKRARFFSRLAKDGFSEVDIRRVTCPIGVGGIASKAPESIAVAVAAQLLQLSAPKLEVRPKPDQGRARSMSADAEAGLHQA